MPRQLDPEWNAKHELETFRRDLAGAVAFALKFRTDLLRKRLSWEDEAEVNLAADAIVEQLLLSMWQIRKDPDYLAKLTGQQEPYGPGPPGRPWRTAPEAKD